MISIVIPTRNRAYTLELVSPSYFFQNNVNQIIIVDDCGEDCTYEVIRAVADRFPTIELTYIRNDERKGAAASRNIGARNAKNEFVLFCDDDEYLEEDYATTCLKKLDDARIGAVSGRRVYMKEGENQEQALARFDKGIEKKQPFNFRYCEYNNEATYDGDIELPFTNAIILTRKELLERYGFDEKYNRGNGYREETDYQMNIYVNGYKIIASNDCHSFHLPRTFVSRGGQRTSRISRLYWRLYYTHYFYKKYHHRFKEAFNLKAPRTFYFLDYVMMSIKSEVLMPISRVTARRLGI